MSSAKAQEQGVSLGAEENSPLLRHPTAWAIAVFAFALGFYLAWVPRVLRYSSPPTGDQPFYLMDVASLAEDGDLNVKNNYDRSDFDKFYALAPHPPDFVGMPAPYPLERQLAPATMRPPDEEYSHHLPGLPLLLAPAWKIGSWFGLWWPATIVGMCILSALLALNVFLFAFEISASRWAALAVCCALAFSAPVMAYSYLLFTELAVGLLVLFAMRRLALGWEANGWGRLLFVGICIGFIPWLAWRCVLLAATLTGYAIWQWRAALRTSGRRAASILMLLAPVLVSLALILRYHYFLYGEPSPPMRVPELGDVSPFHWPWQGGAGFALFFTQGLGLLFDQTFGLLPYSPVYLLGVAGAIAMWRSPRAEVRRLVPELAAVLLPYLGTLAAFELWHGIWCPPARYLTSLAPLAAAPIAVFLAGSPRRWRRIASLLLFLGLAVPGWSFMGILMQDARRFWPNTVSPVFDALAAVPLAFGSIDLRAWIPTFVTPDETLFPYQLGGWLVASFLLVAVASALSSPRAGSRNRNVLGWSAGLVLVAGMGLLAAAPFLRHKTELVERGRWFVGSSQEDPRGIAYVDGRIFIACYGTRLSSGATLPGKVVVLDLATGQVNPLQLVAQGVPLAWDFPGDVKLGPQGLLYVLNNGPGDRALFIVRPDGELLRQLATPLNTSVAKGLALSPDGSLLISDMVGGALRRFRFPLDGSSVLEGRTLREGLTNPAAIAADSQGRVLVGESHRWLQQFAADGTALHKFDTCSVRSFATPTATSPWVDASCDQRLFSINTRQSTLQLARVRSGAPLEAILTALTYGADGLLYTLQGGTLVAYEVTH